MKYLNVLVTIIAIVVLGLAFRLYSLENALKNFSENSQLIASSNQALINANTRLENEVVNLRKEVSAIKENFPKK